MKKFDIITGKRFFKYDKDKDKTYAFRVTHVWNESKIECIDESNKNTLFFKKRELKEYNFIIPDLIYCISLVSTTKAQNDIIIYIMRRKDLDEFAEPIPYIIGRQMIVNDKNADQIILGDYITNARENSELALFLTSSGVHSTIMINSYLDDTLEDIENLMPKGTRNNIDKMMKDNFYNFKEASLKHNYTGKIIGPQSIHDLLFSMQASIDDSIGISNIDINTISKEELELFIGKPFTNLSVIEYKKDIDLDRLQSNYFLSRFEDGKVYLVSYSLISEDLLK